jgi:hypothetical protein
MMAEIYDTMHPSLVDDVMAPLLGANARVMHARQTDAHVCAAGILGDDAIPVLAGEVGLCALVRDVAIQSTIPRLTEPGLLVTVLEDPGGGGENEGEPFMYFLNERGLCLRPRRDGIVAILTLVGGFHGTVDQRPRLSIGMPLASSRILVRAGQEAFDTVTCLPSTCDLVFMESPPTPVPQWERKAPPLTEPLYQPIEARWRLLTNRGQTCRAIMGRALVHAIPLGTQIVMKRHFGMPVSPELLPHFPREMGIVAPEESFLERTVFEAARQHLKFGPSTERANCMCCYWGWDAAIKGMFFRRSDMEWIVAIDTVRVFRLVPRTAVSERQMRVHIEPLPRGWRIVPLLLTDVQLALLYDASTTGSDDTMKEHSRAVLGATHGPLKYIPWLPHLE